MTRGIVFIPNFSCGPCIYCNETSELKPEDLLRCEVCRRSAHLKCLKSGVPSRKLIGDNFFHFTCLECSPSNSEIVVRAKLTMVQVLLLALYNLHVTNKDESNKGFFHYKTHIHNFIMKNWLKIYSYDGLKMYKEKNKLPPNCISGQLSHSSSYFIPGKRRGGWYRLKVTAPPAHLIHNNSIQFQTKKRGLNDPEPSVEEAKVPKLNDYSSGSSSCSSLSTLSSTPLFKEELQEESSIESVDESSRGSWYLDVVKPEARLPSNIFDEEEDGPLDVEEPIQVEKPALDQLRPPTPDEEEPTSLKITSLFSKSEEPVKESLEENEHSTLTVVRINPYEERKLVKKLDAMQNLSPELYRLRRKLKVRQTKREHGLPLFNIDMEVKFFEENSRLMTDKERGILNSLPNNHMCNESTFRILDRFQVPERHFTQKKAENKSFRMKLTGSSENSYEFIHSPYSLRTIKPFIFRDYHTTPLKLKLLLEIESDFRRRNGDTSRPPSRRPIDYCYVTPKHIPAMNHLAREFFWPGIDLSEALHYPDFTCVVLYGQLVVGFGVVVPDTKLNEAYVSFLFVHPEWRRAGIAKFILYHLIQTSPEKDVTLHVSATNPALIMYQQFGFKVEEFLSDFYDKYLPEDSPECKHAMFMRLRR